jgi:hypothetical protein
VARSPKAYRATIIAERVIMLHEIFFLIFIP